MNETVHRKANIANASVWVTLPQNSVTTLAQRTHNAVSGVLPQVEYALSRLDYRVPLGAVVTLCVVIFGITVNVPQHHAIAVLRQQLAQPRAHPRSVADTPQTAATFVSALPSRADIPKVLGVIYKQAADADVALERGNYEFTLTRSGALARYQFTFPLKSTYPKIRDFIDKTLLAVPAVGIDSLRLERKNIGEEAVNAELRFTLFVQNPA